VIAWRASRNDDNDNGVDDDDVDDVDVDDGDDNDNNGIKILDLCVGGRKEENELIPAVVRS